MRKTSRWLPSWRGLSGRKKLAALVLIGFIMLMGPFLLRLISEIIGDYVAGPAKELSVTVTSIEQEKKYQFSYFAIRVPDQWGAIELRNRTGGGMQVQRGRFISPDGKAAVDVRSWRVGNVPRVNLEFYAEQISGEPGFRQRRTTIDSELAIEFYRPRNQQPFVYIIAPDLEQQGGMAEHIYIVAWRDRYLQISTAYRATDAQSRKLCARIVSRLVLLD